MSDITLTNTVRSNLLSLRGTADMMSETQTRLATGNKVNSALDNPSNWFTAQGLNNRASDLNSLMDSMSNGVKTLEAADNGLTAISKTLESMQSTLRQARQDKSFETESYDVTDNLTDGKFAAASTVSFLGGAGIDDGGDPAAAIEVDVADMTLDEAIKAINEDEDVAGKVRASNDNGKLRIENLSTQELTVAGTTSVGGGTIEGNSVRADLANQYNELRDQLDKLADDASFNGINLLRGDKLSITFNETGTSSIDIQTEEGKTINAANLEISTTMAEETLDSDTDIDLELDKLKNALNEVRSQSSTFGSNLSMVENRQAFTESMIDTLQGGAGDLTLADMNTEAANLLALQTRQQLGQNSLSLASQADQSILQLIR